MVHVNNGILSHKNEQNNAICSDMDGPRDYHTKWTKKDNYTIISLTWNLKKWHKWTYLQNKHSNRNQSYGNQWGETN